MYIAGLDAKNTMRDPITLEPRKTLLDARNTMLKYRISRIIVADAKSRKPLGILTEKDMAQFLYKEVPSRRLDEITLEEVMSRDLATVNEDASLTSCAKLMLEKGISSVIVVTKGGRNLAGIITKSDLTDAYVRYYAGEHLVEEFMTRKVLVVAPDEPIHMAMLLMKNNKVSRVVVADRNRRPVGIITGRDLLPVGALFGTGTFGSYWAAKPELVARKRQQAFIPSGIKEMFVASDVMTPNPITITKKSDLADAAYLMQRNGISGLPVVEQGSKGNLLVGIVTKTNVIKAMAMHG